MSLVAIIGVIEGLLPTLTALLADAPELVASVEKLIADLKSKSATAGTPGSLANEITSDMSAAANRLSSAK